MNSDNKSDLLQRRTRGYLARMPAATGENRQVLLANAVNVAVCGFAMNVLPGVDLLLRHYASQCDPPATADELRKLAEELWSKPGQKGWLLQGRSNAAVRPLQRSASSLPDPLSSSPNNLTDLGNAELLVQQFGDDIHYCHAWEKWLMWGGRRWETDTTGEIYRRTYQILRRVQQQYGQGSPSPNNKVFHHYYGSENVNRIKGLLELARNISPLPVIPNSLDNDPWLFNCGNGTLDLRTGQLRPHDRKDLLTKLSSVNFNPNAASPGWDSFVSTIMNGNAPMIAFLQRYMGYALTGSVREQVLVIFHGEGANGKSTFCIVLQHVLGDYAKQAPPELLVSKRFGSPHPTEIADLFGARWVVDSEVSPGQRFDEAKVKRLTGGDRIKARFLYQDFFEFSPTHKLVLLVNHKPEVRGTDGAIWRRLLMVPFSVTIPADKRVKDLAEKLECESEGILAWALRGCLEWQKQGLAPPAEVLHATQEYQADMDLLAQFITDRCVPEATASIGATELYSQYKTWCETEGIIPLAQRTFGQRVGSSQRGITRVRSTKSGRNEYHGIRIRVQTDGAAEQQVGKPSATGTGTVDQFLATECVPTAGYVIEIPVFYGGYKMHCDQLGVSPLSWHEVDAHLRSQGHIVQLAFEDQPAMLLGFNWRPDGDVVPEGTEPMHPNPANGAGISKKSSNEGSVGSVIDLYPKCTGDIRHYADVVTRVQEAHRLLGIVNEQFTRAGEILQEMAKVSLNGDRLSEYFEVVMPLPTDNDVVRQKTIERHNRLKDLFETGEGNNLPGVRGSLYAARGVAIRPLSPQTPFPPGL